MRCICTECMEGQDTCLSFTDNLSKLANNTYFMAGKFVSWSLSQGGPGLPVLNPLTFRFIFHLSLPKDLSPFFKTIQDEELLLVIENVSKFHWL